MEETKTIVVEQRPAGSVEDTQKMVPEEAMQRHLEQESKLELELINTEGPKKTEKDMQTLLT